MSNTYIYLKEKLAGPVEMEEPVAPDKKSYWGGMIDGSQDIFDSMAYNHDLHHYESNLEIYKAYLESLPSIEVHESLKSKLVENGRYELGRNFKIDNCKCVIGDGCPFNPEKWFTPCKIAFPHTPTVVPVSDPAPQPERLFTLKEMKACWEDSASVMRSAIFGGLAERLEDITEPHRTAFKALVEQNAQTPFPITEIDNYLKSKFNIDIQ